MIKMSLMKRIWISFLSLILLIGLLIGTIYHISLKSTLTEEAYRIIEDEYDRYLILNKDFSSSHSHLDLIATVEEGRSVGHLLLKKDLSKLGGDKVPDDVFKEMEENAIQQQVSQGRYKLTYKQNMLFYVINKVDRDNGGTYHISFMWDTYRDQIVQRLWRKLFYIMALASVLSIIPALWLKHYLRQPFISLRNRFEEISKRSWKKPLNWEGDDSLEQLSNQFEEIRQNLIQHDQEQKTFMQHASHELKTPIMVIKSYAKSVKDGMVPKEKMEKTMDIILEETDRMEERVRNILYYTKLDSFKASTIEKEAFPFGAVAYEMEERFRLHREDVSFVVKGDRTIVYGNKALIQVLLENLIENALRYAMNVIEIKAEEEKDHMVISVFNNGELIREKDMSSIFQSFQKGNKGQYGLGLAIVKRICELHDGYPTVSNEKDGVRFSMIIGKQKKVKRSKKNA